MFVDSHCHLDRLDPATHEGSLAAALQAARARDVRQFLAVAVTLDDVPTLAGIAREHADVAISAGVHPLHLLDCEPELESIKETAERFGVVAIGECGLDYHYLDKAPERVPSREIQRERFRRQLVAATELELPVIVHTRDAREDTLALIREHSDPAIGGVLHCFTEDLEMAREAVRHGFYISLSGIVTFRNAESLREVARRVPLDRLLIETDSPYLAPVPHRGRPNEPAWVVEVAHCIAGERGISVEEVAMQTTANFYRLFRHAAPEVSAETREVLARAGLV
ncbi:TatD family hydrolase [Halomonas sp. MCCC 1A17488]|uniref:TatD family hydrolase n=1 Tax=Billgrantia sulfidoxydans TaxID=2733484 RepID=A0ABX7W4G2_9GAMM|nr:MULTISPECIES: TatD family hydrolase [Halomonas]MCE8015655.1 TatD family hydrolase [Halomonas sp. MCCC 1A17488]MCG3238988.1 TatD family hydrolase [Halomonas sp. MCCC 1A17488]QPP51060.1 TatD family hydrolase [Halomonas sp. SS10-MC5]QTP54572.1 TatD family hydrolase [Halomonas sulfidoxydans]